MDTSMEQNILSLKPVVVNDGVDTYLGACYAQLGIWETVFAPFVSSGVLCF